MEYLFLFAALALVLLIYMIRIWQLEKQKAAKFEAMLREEYGSRPPKKYPEGRLAALAQHFNRGKEHAFTLDEITLTDLDFEALFRRIDRTHSAAGEEGLYRMLRIPCFDPGELSRRKDLITYFAQQPEHRVRLQIYFAAVGRTGKYSVYDYLDAVMALEKKSNLPHFTMILLMAASLLLMIPYPSLGLLGLLALLCVNFVTYFKQLREIEPYITTFAYFLRILDLAEKLEKLKIDRIAFLTKEIKEEAARFEGFARFAFFLTNTDSMSGSPMDILVDYLRMGLHLNLIKFNSMLDMVQKNEDAIIGIMERLGYLEALLCAGEFAESLPGYTWAQLKENAEDQKVSGCKLSAEGLYHPLLENPVSNDIELAGPMLLTGSNASGKSTFLKTVAIAQLMAQSFGFVCATAYRSAYYRLFTSMALRDDLRGGRSYFIVEIESLKRILDAANVDKEFGQMTAKPGIMCFVDEVLRGTNTVERIAASTEILESLAEKGVFAFAATHDIELTTLLEHSYANYHFEETVEDGDVKFNYCIQQGKAKSRNAILLLSVMGYEEAVTQRAARRAEHFARTGEWQ